MQYLLDSNIYIEGFKRYYAMDIYPGFWELIVSYSTKNRICSIDRVKDELNAKDDELENWVFNAPSELFVSTAKIHISRAYSEVVEWVNGNAQFKDYAKTKFFEGADGWLVAEAYVNKSILVTHEKNKYDPNVKKRAPLGNVCDYFTRIIHTKVGLLKTIPLIEAIFIPHDRCF